MTIDKFRNGAAKCMLEAVLDSGSVQHVHARCAARRHLHGGIPGAQARSEVSRPLPAALRPGQTLFKKRGAPPDSISRRSMNGSWPLHGRRRARPLQRRPHTVGRSCRAGTGSARQACNRPLARAVMTEHARAPTSAARGGRPKISLLEGLRAAVDCAHACRNMCRCVVLLHVHA